MTPLPSTRWRRLAVLGAVVLAMCACTGSESDSGSASTLAPSTKAVATTAVPETTTSAARSSTSAAATVSEQPPSAPTAPHTEPGPYAVGVRTDELPTSNLVEIWYPAASADPTAVEEYRLRTFLPEVFAPIIPSEVDDTFGVVVERSADPSDEGPFPVILFSHGFSSFRLQSTELLRHLASWGFIVASPDHPSRDLASQLGAVAQDPPGAVDDLRSTRTLVEELASEGPLSGAIDPTRIVLAGHSAGGSTVLEMASDNGILGYISMAAGAGEADLPDLPSLFMAAENDGVVETSRTSAAFSRAPSPSWLWTIGDAGHLAFSDLCAIGTGEGGLIGLAESAGIDQLVPENLRRLATDGCLEPNRPVPEVWPAVHHAATVFALSVTGDTEVGRELDANPVGSVRVDVSVSIGP